MTKGLPKQPTITEVAPGEIEIDKYELAQYQKDMIEFEKKFEEEFKDVDWDNEEDQMAAINRLFE